MARLAEAGFRISLTPDTGDGHREEWRSTLTSAGVLAAVPRQARRRVASTRRSASSSSTRTIPPRSAPACKAARTNARFVRTKITARHVGGDELHLARLSRRSSPPRSPRRGCPSCSTGSASTHRCSAARCSAPSCATTPTTSASSAPSSSAPTTRRASSTSNTSSCCRPTRRSAATSTPTSGRRSCARSPAHRSYRHVFHEPTGPGTSPIS